MQHGALVLYPLFFRSNNLVQSITGRQPTKSACSKYNYVETITIRRQRKIEEIKPTSKDHLNMYSCGPTVLQFAHIGNLRSFIMADLLYRTPKIRRIQAALGNEYYGHWRQNHKRSNRKIRERCGAKGSLRILPKFIIQAFLKDLREVNILVDEIEFIRVTDKNERNSGICHQPDK